MNNRRNTFKSNQLVCTANLKMYEQERQQMDFCSILKPHQHKHIRSPQRTVVPKMRDISKIFSDIDFLRNLFYALYMGKFMYIKA
jgi:hypothetical protein